MDDEILIRGSIIDIIHIYIFEKGYNCENCECDQWIFFWIFLQYILLHTPPPPFRILISWISLPEDFFFAKGEKEEKCNNKIVDFKKLSKDEVRRVVKLNINRLIPPTNSFSLRLIIGYLPLIGYNYIFIINVEI